MGNAKRKQFTLTKKIIRRYLLPGLLAIKLSLSIDIVATVGITHLQPSSAEAQN